MTNNKFSWHPSEAIENPLGKDGGCIWHPSEAIENPLGKDGGCIWHPSEATKRCQPSALGGKSARKHGGCLAWALHL